MGKKDKPRSYKYPLLCFDSETTNHGELLELSVFDLSGNEVYHKYFKPRAKKWPTDIHHITPEMVADCKRFAEHRSEIRELLNSTRYLAGCALSNDLNNLRRHGVRLNDGHTVFEIQNWYWLLNDPSNRHEKQQAGLAAIAERYGLTFGDEHAHSATADTRVTLECFKALASDFDVQFSDDRAPSIEPMLSADSDVEVATNALTALYKRYSKAFQYAMQVYRMNNSAGYINVVRREQGFSLKYTRFEQTGNENILFSVPVEDRVKAETDLRNYFEPIQIKGFTGIYRMKSKDFDYIKEYRNTIDIETFIARQKEAQKTKQATMERARKSIAAKNNNTASKETDSTAEVAKATRKSAASSRRKTRSKAKTKSKTRAATHAMRTAKKATKDKSAKKE